MGRISEFRNQYKQYGLFRFLIYLSILLLRIIDIKYEKYLYFSIPINVEKQKDFWKKREINDVIELTLSDFHKGDPYVFDENKIRIYEDRFKRGSYHSYGIFRDNKLIYSCWISLEDMYLADNLIYKVDSSESFKLDAYCHPQYRGKGIHSAMNSYRVIKGYEYGKVNSTVLVYWLNYPAIKSQLKIGYKIIFSFYIIRIWGMTISNFKKMKEKCR